MYARGTLSLIIISLFLLSMIGCQNSPEVLPTAAQSNTTRPSTEPISPSPPSKQVTATSPHSNSTGVGATPSVIHPMPEGTPAGDGVLTDQVGDPIEFLTGEFIPLGYAWYVQTEQGFILVFSGEDAHDPEQGLVIVVRSGTIWEPIGSQHESPTKSGGLLIDEVLGKRLILKSTTGETYFFDVPAGRFVESMDEVAPTMTPGPTITLQPTIRELAKDDAPDAPDQAVIDRPFNTALHFYIDFAGDEDWHIFRLRKQADIVFTLLDLPEPFGIEVFSRRNFDNLGENDTPDTEDKTLIIPQAPEGYYLVRVWGIDGAWNMDRPYTLVVSIKE